MLLRGLQSDRTSIHKNLLLCLLAVELSFLVGLHQTGSPVVCGVLAGLMHFFLMAAFFWLFFEAFQLYVTLTVFESERSRLRWYYVASYGVPLLVVAVSCVVDPVSYGTAAHCWLRTDNYFVFSFAGPAIILILVSLSDDQRHLFSSHMCLFCRCTRSRFGLCTVLYPGRASAPSRLGSGRSAAGIQCRLTAHLAPSGQCLYRGTFTESPVGSVTVGCPAVTGRGKGDYVMSATPWLCCFSPAMLC